MSVQSFQNYWQDTHAPLVVKQTNVRRYVQNVVLEPAYRNREPLYDGVAEVWFEDMAALREFNLTKQYKLIEEDSQKFLDSTKTAGILTNEKLIVDQPPPRDAAKMIAFLTKRADISVAGFQDHWRLLHGPIAGAIPGNQRYVQNHVRPGYYQSGRTPVFDGIAMSWFADVDALRQSGNSAEYKKTRADEANFLSGERIPFLITKEVEILCENHVR